MVERRGDACSTDVEDGVHGVSSGRTTGARGERGRRQGCRCGGKTGDGEGGFGRGRDASAASGRAGGERRLHGEKQRGRWSEGNFVINSKFQNAVCNFQFFSFFLASNEKLLNTKVVQNFEIYNFHFRQKFI